MEIARRMTLSIIDLGVMVLLLMLCVAFVLDITKY